MNEKETCPEEVEQPNDDEVSRIVKKYIKNFSGIEKCKYLYFGRGISEKKVYWYGLIVPIDCHVGHDNVRFLKGLFTSLMDSETLRKE